MNTSDSLSESEKECRLVGILVNIVVFLGFFVMAAVLSMVVF